MAMGIDKIFEMLSCNNSKRLQKKGIEEGKKIKYLSVFMQPIEDKSIWENCAKIISSKKDNELELYLFNLLEWLEDSNNLGFDIIYNRLDNISKDLLYTSYSISINEAIKLQDKVWLKNLSMLAKNYELYDKLRKREREIIDKYIKLDKIELEKKINASPQVSSSKSHWKIGDVYAYELKSNIAREKGLYGQYLILRMVDISKTEKNAVIYCQISKKGVPITKKEIEELDYVTIYIKENVKYSCRFEISNLTKKVIKENMIYIGNFDNILEPNNKYIELTKENISVDFYNLEKFVINCISIME